LSYHVKKTLFASSKYPNRFTIWWGLLGVLILVSSALQLVAPILSKYIVDEIIARITTP
jgi:ABC-type multidrug transport system fused ATPase/permease subunit